MDRDSSRHSRVRPFRIVLASVSPRRRAILQSLAVPFEAIDPAIDEEPLPGETPGQIAGRLAEAKARTVAAIAPGRVAIAADTVVAVDGEALGKPPTPEEAWRMLRLLRRREHQVITAIAAAVRDDESGGCVTTVRVATARVWMRDYTDADIEAYIARLEPFDKAGGYAIQDDVFCPCTRVEGCYLTVVGLPLPELCAVLADVGVDLPLEASHLQAACSLCAADATPPISPRPDASRDEPQRYGTCSGALPRHASMNRMMRGSS